MLGMCLLFCNVYSLAGGRGDDGATPALFPLLIEKDGTARAFNSQESVVEKADVLRDPIQLIGAKNSSTLGIASDEGRSPSSSSSSLGGLPKSIQTATEITIPSISRLTGKKGAVLVEEVKAVQVMIIVTVCFNFIMRIIYFISMDLRFQMDSGWTPSSL